MRLHQLLLAVAIVLFGALMVGADDLAEVVAWDDQVSHGSVAVVSDEMQTGPITVASEVYVGTHGWSQNDFIDFARLSSFEDSDDVLLALRAEVVSVGFFGTTWRMKLLSDEGLLGEFDEITLHGLNRHLLEADATYHTLLAYDPQTGSVSASLTVTDKNGNERELFKGFLNGAPAEKTYQGGVWVEAAQLEGAADAINVLELAQSNVYSRQGGNIFLLGARAVARTSPGERSGNVLLREDPLVFVLVREPGPLNGFFRLDVHGMDEPLFEVSAQEEITEVNLGLGTVEAGEYTASLVYVEYGPDDATVPVYTEKVADVSWNLVPPIAQAKLTLSGQAIMLRGELPPQLRGDVILTLNQSARDVHIRLTNAEKDELLDRIRPVLRKGETRVPFTYRVDQDLDPEDLKIFVDITGADGMPPIEAVYEPFKIPAVVAESFEFQVESTSFFGNEPQDVITVDESLVKVWAHPAVDKETLSNIVLYVHFKSPSGRVVSIPARRISLRETDDPIGVSFTMQMNGLKWGQMRPTDVYHWFSEIKPNEVGVWEYAVEALNTDARLDYYLEDPAAATSIKNWRWSDGPTFPGRLTIGEGTFEVFPSDTDVAAYGSVDADAPRQISRLRLIDDTTIKIEQVTGDWDKHLHRPTLNQTLSRSAVAGTDLGRSFEHEGDLILLFGDTVGPDGFIQSFVARSTVQDPEAEGGLAFDIYNDRFRRNVALRLQPPGHPMGGFEVPTGGISLNGKMYIVVRSPFRDPYGRGLLVHFDTEASRFHAVRELSPLGGKFTEVELRLAPGPVAGLPDDREWVLMWGSGEAYRRSPIYLAAIPADQFELTGVTRYFMGLDEHGVPMWGYSEDDAIPVINADVGEFSIIRVEELDIWVFMFADMISWSKEPWGPWSGFIHAPILGVASDSFQYRGTDPYLEGPIITPGGQGGTYGHYMIERFTRVQDDVLRLYYLISTWNPYEVVLMRSDFEIIYE